MARGILKIFAIPLPQLPQTIAFIAAALTLTGCKATTWECSKFFAISDDKAREIAVADFIEKIKTRPDYEGVRNISIKEDCCVINKEGGVLYYILPFDIDNHFRIFVELKVNNRNLKYSNAAYYMDYCGKITESFFSSY